MKKLIKLFKIYNFEFLKDINLELLCKNFLALIGEGDLSGKTLFGGDRHDSGANGEKVLTA